VLSTPSCLSNSRCAFTVGVFFPKNYILPRSISLPAPFARSGNGPRLPSWIFFSHPITGFFSSAPFAAVRCFVLSFLIPFPFIPAWGSPRFPVSRSCFAFLKDVWLAGFAVLYLIQIYIFLLPLCCGSSSLFKDVFVQGFLSRAVYGIPARESVILSANPLRRLSFRDLREMSAFPLLRSTLLPGTNPVITPGNGGLATWSAGEEGRVDSISSSYTRVQRR